MNPIYTHPLITRLTHTHWIESYSLCGLNLVDHPWVHIQLMVIIFLHTGGGQSHMLGFWMIFSPCLTPLKSQPNMAGMPPQEVGVTENLEAPYGLEVQRDKKCIL